MSEILKPLGNDILPSVLSESRATREGVSTSEEDKEKACKGFESYFIFNMLKDLQKTTQLSKKKGYAEETYMSIVYEKVADFLADRGIGIKQMLMRYADRGNDKENAKVLKGSGDNTDT
jgi:Rod binding domain-containing protein